MRKLFLSWITVVVVLLNCLYDVQGCSNIIVSPEASLDGSSIVAYNADSSTLYGSLYHYPAGAHPAGSMRQVYDWDTGVFLGVIPEAEYTYNVVGNVNEYGVIIGETTYGGVASLQSQPGAIIDYGSLIWITLQRAKTAREAIETIGKLVAEYGYASEGESFSIADPNEAWILEIIGKGSYEKGAVWVARKVPAGYVCAHANQARIQTFPLNDPDTTIYAADVISFARKIGLYPQDAKDEDFSFSDVYDAVTFDGARFCEARVWSFFSTIMGDDFAEQYLDYAQGYNLTNRMPLFVKPAMSMKLSNKENKQHHAMLPVRLSVLDVMTYMRSHYENTPLDMSGQGFSDVGAMLNSIYRTHPLTWTSTITPSGKESSTPLEYFNERPIATPQTGWNFVAQARKYVPRELAGLLWFGVDDSGTTVRFPIYGSATRLPASFAGAGPQDGVVPPMMTFSLKSAFYVFNLLANFAYNRWDLMYPEILTAITNIEKQFQTSVQALEGEVQQMITKNQEGLTSDEEKLQARQSVSREVIEKITSFSEGTGNQLTDTWFNFFGQLFVKYRDGYVITPDPASTACGCNPVSASYPQAWYDRIVKDTGDHYYAPYQKDSIHQARLKDEKAAHLLPVSKKSLKALK